MRALALIVVLLLAPFSVPAWADVPPPPGAAALARQPDIVDRFLGAALGGPDYYGFFLLPVRTDKLARVPDGYALDFMDWSEFSVEEPLVLAEIRALTGLTQSLGLTDPDVDRSVLVIIDRRDDLKSSRETDAKLKLPYYTATPVPPGAQCGVFAMSENPFKPRQIVNVGIRAKEGLTDAAADHCLARALLRGLGLGGLGEYASAAPGPLTEEEKFFLWLAYRLPIGADRETLRQMATEILAGL